MTRNVLLTRLENCQQNKLCFVSLKPLEGNGAVARVYNMELGKEVRVLKQYVK